MIASPAERPRQLDAQLTARGGPSRRPNAGTASSTSALPPAEPDLDALARAYLARLLGHAPTQADAASLPGIDVSDL